MNFLNKLKETVLSVVPVMAIVLVLGLTVAPLQPQVIVRFMIGGVLLILGLTAFLMGVDIGIQPIGERVGAALVGKKNLALLLIVSFFIGFLVTVAEPDIQVFGDQIHSVFNSVNKSHLVYMIAFGVGLFIMLGLLKTVLSFPIKIVLLISYILVFILAFLTPENFRGVAFDSGGATTGPMTVPFILALGVGVSKVRSGSKKANDGSDDFGLTGITSVGPIVAVLLYGIILNSSGALTDSMQGTEQGLDEQNSFGIFLRILPHVFKEAAVSMIPLVALFLIFQVLLLKLPPKQFARISVGLVWAYLGLSIFLLGVNGGFMSTGRELGVILGTKASTLGVGWKVLLVVTGLILGAVVVCAEPAVWVLTEQVESLSGGTIKRKFMLVFLSVGAAIAIGLTMLRALWGFNLMKILVPGYALALLLMILCPRLFTAIAFDSGGVASGPITSTFVLSFTIGASQACGVTNDSFGVIALVAMTPLIAIQVLGIIFSRKRKANKIDTAEVQK